MIGISLTRLACLATLLVFSTVVYAQIDDPIEQWADAAALSPPDETAPKTPLDGGLLSIDSEDQERTGEQSFFISLLMIIVSEIGDKTFLIAAIMAMKHPRIVVFAAAFCSLALMSVLSALLGHVLPNLIPKQYTDVLAALLFLGFGIRMMYEGYYMDGQEGQDEMSEVEQELKEVENRDKTANLEAMEVGGMEQTVEQKPKTEQIKDGLMNLMQLVFSPVFVQTFVLTFLGEWGDRSQISTIALAAANNVYWVGAGVIIGHTLCSAMAVMGGRMLASKISVRTVTFAGSVLFIIFGLYYSYYVYQGQLE